VQGSHYFLCEMRVVNSDGKKKSMQLCTDEVEFCDKLMTEAALVDEFIDQVPCRLRNTCASIINLISTFDFAKQESKNLGDDGAVSLDDTRSRFRVVLAL